MRIVVNLCENASNNGAIYAIHHHPEQQRLAAGGGDGKIRIWSTEAAPGQSPNYDMKLLSVFGQNDSINCVRWSHSGDYLASASDSGLIVIWTKKSVMSEGQTVFGSGEVIFEEYRQVTVLRGHTISALGLCWAPTDTRIASCSVDNCIFIWSVAEKQIVMRLSPHYGHVKGIAWDPLDRFLLSQGEDGCFLTSFEDGRSVSLSDHSNDNEYGSQTQQPQQGSLFLRPAWAPDGAHFAVVSEWDGSGFSASVHTRNAVRSNVLGGHVGSVCCAAFAPILLSNGSHREYLLAIGAKDNGFSIWSEGKSTPLFACANLFKTAPQDVCWAQDGLTLFLCSTDGRIARAHIVIENTDGLSATKPTNVPSVTMCSVSSIPECAPQLRAKMRRGKERKAKANASLLSQESAPNVHTESEQEEIKMEVEKATEEIKKSELKEDEVDISNQSTANLSQQRRIRPTLVTQINEKNNITYSNSNTNTMTTSDGCTEMSETHSEITADGRRRIRPIIVSTNVDSNIVGKLGVNPASGSDPLSKSEQKAQLQQTQTQQLQQHSFDISKIKVRTVAEANFESQGKSKVVKTKRRQGEETERKRKHKHRHKHRNKEDRKSFSFGVDTDERMTKKSRKIPPLLWPCECVRSHNARSLPGIRVRCVEGEDRICTTALFDSVNTHSRTVVINSVENPPMCTRVVMVSHTQGHIGGGRALWSALTVGKPLCVRTTPFECVIFTREIASGLLLCCTVDSISGVLRSPPTTLTHDSLLWAIVEHRKEDKYGRVSVLTSNGDVFFLRLPSLEPILRYSPVASIAALVQPDTQTREAANERARELDLEHNNKTNLINKRTYHTSSPHQVEDFMFERQTGYPTVTISFRTEKSDKFGLVRRSFTLNPTSELWELIFDTESNDSTNVSFVSLNQPEILTRPIIPTGIASREMDILKLELEILQSFSTETFPAEVFNKYSQLLVERNDVERLRHLFVLLGSKFQQTQGSDTSSQIKAVFQNVQEKVMGTGNRQVVRLAEEWKQCINELESKTL